MNSVFGVENKVDFNNVFKKPWADVGKHYFHPLVWPMMWDIEQFQHEQDHQPSKHRAPNFDCTLDFVAGLVGGCAGLAFGHPFDTIKVRQQLNSCGNNLSVVQCAKKTLVNEGIRGFFKGMAFPLGAVGLLNSVFFGVYGNSIRFLEDKSGTDRVSYRAIFFAGGLAGAVQAIPACPVDLVKIKLQSQQGLVSTQQYKGPLDCLQSIHHSHGLRGCFRGLNLTVLREVPGFAVYITSYEYMCHQLTPNDKKTPSVSVMLGAGGLAGMLSWLVNIPIDVLKSRIQSDDFHNPKYRGTVDCLLKSYKEGGVRIFWRGLPVTCLRAFPTNAVTLAVYSCTYHALKEFHDGYETKSKDQSKRGSWEMS